MNTVIRRRYADIAHTVLRVAAGLLFAQHGAQKLFGALGGFGPPPGGRVQLLSLMGLAGVIEFFGGILIALGVLTRPVALVAAAEMAVAYVMAHAPRGVWPILNQGEPALLYCFVFLYLAAAGPGPHSVDARRPVARMA